MNTAAMFGRFPRTRARSSACSQSDSASVKRAELPEDARAPPDAVVRGLRAGRELARHLPGDVDFLERRRGFPAFIQTRGPVVVHLGGRPAVAATRVVEQLERFAVFLVGGGKFVPNGIGAAERLQDLRTADRWIRRRPPRSAPARAARSRARSGASPLPAASRRTHQHALRGHRRIVFVERDLAHDSLDRLGAAARAGARSTRASSAATSPGAENPRAANRWCASALLRRGGSCRWR